MKQSTNKQRQANDGQREALLELDIDRMLETDLGGISLGEAIRRASAQQQSNSQEASPRPYTHWGQSQILSSLAKFQQIAVSLISMFARLWSGGLNRVNPTIAVWTGAMTVFVALLTIAMLLPHPGYEVLMPLSAAQTIAVFVLYMVIHDAAHRMASKSRRLNDLMLISCGVIFLFDPYLYRRLHLTHHAHTNENDDPDHFTASPYLVMRVIKSFLVFWSYQIYALRRFKKNATLFLHLCFTPGLVAALCWVFAMAGRIDVLLACWFIPVVVALGGLSYLLTALPHHPATDTSRIGAARNLDVPRILQLMLGNQHLHLVHHYAPTVPWYQLPRYWRENKDRLVAQGAAPVP